MSQTSKIILVAVIVAFVSGGSVYLWQHYQSPDLSLVSTTQQSKSILDTARLGAVKYNCELSGGIFNDSICECPIEKELDQTQEMMYDSSTGFCQTTLGVPGGDAFAVSVGLPYGDYDFYNDIVQNNCQETGGEFLYTCNCPKEKTYDKLTGYCK